MNKSNDNEMIGDIFVETKDVYNRNNENINKIDSKLVQLFTFITALLLLFINIIQLPETLIMRIIYIIVGLLFISSLIMIILVYQPMPYLSINPNDLINKYCEGGYKSRKELIGAMAGTIAASVLSIKKIIIRKTKTIKICSYLSVIALILLIILKVNGA